MRATSLAPLLLVALAPLGSEPLASEPVDATPIANSPLQFRRVFVPADRIKELASGTLPKKLEEFEQLLRQMQSAAKEQAAGAVITRAEYTARLDQLQLVAGEARLDVNHRGPQATAISFGASRLAISNPMWDEPQPRSATLAHAAGGLVVLIVEKSGRLKFPWTLRGSESVLGGVEFDLSLPPSASNRLTLELPPGLAPVVDRGVVLAAKNEAEATLQPAGSRQWAIELGGNTRVSLRVVPERTLAKQQQLVLLRESLNYSLSTSGLGFSAELRLDVYHEPLRRLIIRPDSGLHLTSARFRDKPLVMSTLPESGGSSQVVLEFPEPILGSDRQVQLTGVGPILTGEKWKLPALRVEGTVWQEGSTALGILDPLILQDVSAMQGRQAKTRLIPAPGSGEILEFQSFGPGGAIEVQVARPPSRLRLLAGTTISFGSAAVTGVTKAEIAVTQGERFELTCDVTRLWVIDSVETEPSNLLDDWHIAAADARRQQVRIRFKKPLTTKQPARVVVHAHRQPAARSVPLSVEQLRLAEFQDVAESKYLVLAKAEPPHRLEVAGDSELARLDPAKLLPVEADLLERDFTGLLFQDGPGADRLQLSLENERASYSADALVDAVVDGDSLTEEYRIRCRPESSRVARVLIHLSQARKPELAWSILGQEERGTASRRFSEEEQRALGLIGGETWEVAFLPSRGEPFEARAQRSVPFLGKMPLSLASVPEAEGQSGELSVAAVDGTCPLIDGQSLRPLPTRRPPASRYSNTRAVYRYEPAQGAMVRVAPAAPKDGQSLAWAWNCLLTSRYSRGQPNHRARYCLENLGRGQISFTFPQGITVEQILVNESEVPPPAYISAEHTYVVPLPTGIRYPTVSITYSSDRAKFNPWGASGLAPIFPRVDFPVLEKRWTLWLPREVKIVKAGPTGVSGARSQPTPGERLLGPLHGRQTSRPWELLRDTSRLALGLQDQTGSAVPRHDERCRAILGELAERAQTVLTWRELLERYADSTVPEGDAPLLPLLVDREALTLCGIGPQSVVSTAREQTSSETGTAILAAANLTLVERGGDLVLTSALFPPPETMAATGPRFVSLAEWIVLDELPPNPWANPPPSPYASLAATDWQVHALEIPTSGEVMVYVYRPLTIQAAAWSTLFMVAVVVWTVISRRPRWLIPLALASGLFALFFDGLYAPLGTSTFLGVLLGGLFVLAWRGGRGGTISIEDISTRTMPRSAPSPAVWLMAGAIVASIVATLTVRTMAADPSGTQDAEESTQIHPVYIPVDEKRQPTTGYVYLPPVLYEALERAVAAGAPARAWLITTAFYQCQLERAAVGGKLSVAELSAKFDLEVLQAKTKVALPIKRAGIHLFSDRARLDGQPVQVDWSEDGRFVEFEVEQAGKHVLELGLQPTLGTDASFTGFDVSIPRLPRARFKVVVPLGVEGLFSPHACGATQTDTETGGLLIDVGPADSLSLRWPAAGTLVGRPAELEAEEQLWLKVRPGSVVVDAKFKFSRVEGPLREVRLSADPRWRLLPPRADQPIARYRIEEGVSQTIYIELKTPSTTEVSLNLSFLSSGTSGVGSLVLPRLEAICDRSSRRWLGVTIDPALVGELPPATADTTLAPAEFLKAWVKETAATPAEPQVAYRLPAKDPSWSLTTRPKQPQISGVARLDVSYRVNSARLQWEADLNSANGSLFQYKLQTPPGLEIESVSVRQGAAERAGRWSRTGQDSMTIFLTGPISGEQHLIVRGTLDRPHQGDWNLPRLAISDAQLEAERIRIYHHRGTRVQVTAGKGYVPDPTAKVDEYREEFGRLAAAFTADVEAPLPHAPPRRAEFPVLRVAPTVNAPQTECRLITAMLRKPGGWTAHVECRLGVDSGTLDALWLDVPAQWSGPYEVEPSADVQVLELPGQSRRRLLIRPAAPLAGDSVLHITGPLAPAPKGPIAVPNVLPLEMSKVERYVVVPTQVEAQQIVWETSGLQAAPLPLESRGRFPAAEAFAAYQVIGTDFRASIKHVERVSGAPRVRLADIHVTWKVDGACHGLILFDLEPAGLRHCVLEMPSQLELLHVDVAELPALLRPAGGGKWQLELGPDQLPQRISVTFQGGVPHEESPPARLRFAAPALKDIPVENTLWTIRGPDDRAAGRMSVVDGQTDALSQEVLRYTSTAALIARAVDLVLESSPREVADWYAPWGDRLAVSRRAIDVLRLTAGNSTFASAEVANVQREQAALVERLNVARPTNPNDRPAVGRRELFDNSQPSGCEVVCCAFPGAQTTVEVACTRTAGGNPSARLSAGLALVAAAFLLYVLAARGILEEWLARWPAACGVVAGIVWWLFLAPSVLGWVLVAVSVLSALRSPWKSVRSRPDSLTNRSAAPRPVAR